MGLVFMVNAYMVYDAYHTFPGIAGIDGFDLSNEYKRVLATAQQQAALGWQIEAEVTTDHFPVLRLTDRAGAPITVADIDAQAERPVGPLDLTVLTFRPIGDGQLPSRHVVVLRPVGHHADRARRRPPVQCNAPRTGEVTS